MVSLSALLLHFGALYNVGLGNGTGCPQVSPLTIEFNENCFTLQEFASSLKYVTPTCPSFQSYSITSLVPTRMNWSILISIPPSLPPLPVLIQCPLTIDLFSRPSSIGSWLLVSLKRDRDPSGSQVLLLSPTADPSSQTCLSLPLFLFLFIGAAKRRGKENLDAYALIQ